MKKALAVLAILLSGCTAVDVRPVDSAHNLQHVCIENNPKVIVAGFVDTVENVFHDHLITTEVYHSAAPDHCQYRLTYTALRSWDVTPYLSHAEVRLFEGQQRIGYAEYHLRGRGVLDPNKWASVKSKMTPVVQELLAQYR